MKWNIGGTCDKHQDQVTTQSNANLADHPLAGPHIGTADLPKVLKWIHTEGRCALEYITINNPDANHTAKAEDRD